MTPSDLSSKRDVLIIGAGSLGGLLATRLLAAGAMPVLGVRSESSAAKLQRTGLRAMWGDRQEVVRSFETIVHDRQGAGRRFDLILLATKTIDAIKLGPELEGALTPGGAIVPLQNGAFAFWLQQRVSPGRVVGAISNLSSSTIGPGQFKATNDGQIILGELLPGASSRVQSIAEYLRPACRVDTTVNFLGAVWSKLALNCSVTTLGAIAGCTMRQYMAHPAGRRACCGLYDEAISVAAALQIELVSLKVPAIRPGSPGSPGSCARPLETDRWIDELTRFYGDLRASMLQDLESGRSTEIEYQNGYVVAKGAECGVHTPFNVEAVRLVRRLEAERTAGSPELLVELLDRSSRVDSSQASR